MESLVSLRSIFIAGLLLCAPFFAFAQEMVAPDTVAIPPAPELPVQNVSVHNAKVLSQESGVLTVTFSLTNEEDRAQDGILFDIELQGQAGVQSIQTQVKQTVALESRETITPVVEYPLERVTPAEYTVAVSAYTPGGELLAQSMAGTIIVTELDNQAAVYNALSEGGVTMADSDVSGVHSSGQNIYLIISVIAFALSLLVLLLAVARHKKPVTT